MKILGVDTSTMTGSAAIVEDNHVLAELTLNINETHESRLLRTIDTVFQYAGLTPRDIDLFAVGVGPGSFTGLRIGVATLKALAQASGKPLVGVSSLAAAALRYTNAGAYLCPLIDARKKEVFTALFRYQALELIRCLPDQVVSPESFLAEVKSFVVTGPVLFWGSGCGLYAQMIKDKFDSSASILPLAEPSARTVARLGLEKWLRLEEDELFVLQPNYLRKSEAELKWATLKKK